MAFPTGWGRRCGVTIDADYVDGALSDFPVLCTTANLPSEMFDADGSYPARADGGDIRFSSDEAGAYPLAREVVSFTRDNNPANGSAQIWVKATSLSAVVDTVIYVWYAASSETEPAADSAYGREAVWAEYAAVYHMEGVTDASDSGFDLTNVDSTTAAAKIGSGGTFSGGTQYRYRNSTSDLNIGTNDVTISAWVNVAADAEVDYGGIAGKGFLSSNKGFGLYAQKSDKTLWFQVRNGSTAASAKGPGSNLYGSWKHLAGTADRDSTTGSVCYVNGEAGTAENPSSFSAADLSDDERFSIGCREQSGTFLLFLKCQIDELRVLIGAAKPAEWIDAEYNSANAPGTFASAGTPSTPGAGSKFFPHLFTRVA